jgi:hypothetical protein
VIDGTSNFLDGNPNGKNVGRNHCKHSEQNANSTRTIGFGKRIEKKELDSKTP